MLWFERQVVTTLTANLDEGLRAEVEAYVDETLRAMPEHLRAGMAADSVGLGAWKRGRAAAGRTAPRASLNRLEPSRLDPGRQHAGHVRSLVQLASYDLAQQPANVIAP